MSDLVSYIKKRNRYDITDTLLKVVLNMSKANYRHFYLEVYHNQTPLKDNNHYKLLLIEIYPVHSVVMVTKTNNMFINIL